MSIFSAARLKVERANKHIAEVEHRVEALPDRYTATIEINPHGGNKVIKHDLSDRTFKTDVALMVGDAVHNLKCALDYTWLNCIEKAAPSAISNFTKFPVYGSPEKLKDALRGIKIHNACPALYDLMLSEIHPYDGGNIAVWPIHQLDRIDKHRLLIPFVHMASIEGIELEDDRGKTVRGDTWSVSKTPPYYIPVEDGWHIKNKGKVGSCPAFS